MSLAGTRLYRCIRELKTRILGIWTNLVDSILVVCTANICRSPMAERLLQRETEQREIAVQVVSAGVLARQNLPAAPGSVAALAALGLDVSDHFSQPLADLAEHASLVLTMEAAHIPAVVNGQRELFQRTFTLKEILSRTREVGPRGELALEEWIEDLNEGRTAQGVMSSTNLDVADPYGGSSTQFDTCAQQLDELCSRFARSMWGTASSMP
jgi:protein-tyrosine phosphatase